jgi:hypothetical protein
MRNACSYLNRASFVCLALGAALHGLPASAAAAESEPKRVIVLMKNQLSGADAVDDQAPVMDELAQANAGGIRQFHGVNAFTATVSAAELAKLQANPAIAAVVPDMPLRRPHRSTPSSSATRNAAAITTASGPSTTLTPYVVPGACAADGHASLPEPLLTTNTASDDPQAKTARSLGFTGAGVKVAWIADGIDPMNVNFIRRDGSSVFIDYQDFSGDGPGQITSGDEAFLDANAIAGQGIQVYNVNGFSAQSYPFPCNIRIEGMAPGASLVGLDIFGSYEDGTTSQWLEAIDYAAFIDHVDVINESLGSNPFPDIATSNIVALFNDAAVAAGVTVTVSSGDAGFTNTLSSPATDPNVIDVGASTTFRAYAQSNYAAARYFAPNGWLSDNISSLSSGGYSEQARTLDLVAPGDISFASCDDSALFEGCVNFLEQSSDIEESGGTSESAPRTAGAAALVIEAYRKSHGGASPTPALVKQILTSSATDLGTPATEQGAGLLNSYRAVLLAQTINGGHPGSALPADGQLLLSQGQLNAVAAAGASLSWPLTITNASGTGQHVQINGRTLGSDQDVQSGSVTLTDGSNPEFTNYGGLQNNYATFKFHVPAGMDRLDAEIAYPGAPPLGNNDPLNARVRLILVDPQGRLAAHSLPQGVGNFGSADVRAPIPGTWTGVIFGDVASVGGTNGSIPWRVATQQFVSVGSASPSSFYLAPGQSQSVQLGATAPTSPGDASGAFVVSSSTDGSDNYVGVERSTIPVTVRTLVDLADGGSFGGVLTGGNGRAPGQGQANYFEFKVAPGHKSITANVALSNDVADNVGTYLVNPDGVVVGFGQNYLSTGPNSKALSAWTLDPVPGTWTLIIDFSEPVVGDEISQHFSGNIQLDGVHVSAPGLPDDPHIKLAAGVPVTIPVSITNNGAASEQFFIDARLDGSTLMPLLLQFPPAVSSGFALPLGSTADTATPAWFVPTQTSGLEVLAEATLPVVFDYGPYQGDPDLFGGITTANNAAGVYAPRGGTVQAGLWYGDPNEIGPYSAPAPAGFVQMAMLATTKPFDADVSSDTGDAWLTAIEGFAVLNSLTPVVIAPGQTAIIHVTITPTGAPGDQVSGNLYVDDYVGAVPPYFQTSGDELAAIPYSYTIE